VDNLQRDSQKILKRDFSERVRIREESRLRARKKGGRGIWFGLGTFGLVGWAVAIPTVLGIFVGVWIDVTWPGPYSWTLMLLVAGLGAGCANAWFWLQRERRAISRERENDAT
jgi:ATP synthase protein I